MICPGRFAERVVLVTGAAQGIGRAITERLTAEGAHPVLADLDGDRLRGAAKELERDHGVAPVTCVADLTKPESAQRAAAAAVERHGTIDVLVNNVGGGVLRPTLEHTPETLAATIDRNLWTAIHMSRAVLPVMAEHGYGRVVNIGAESVRTGVEQHAVYNAAKAGLLGLTTGLAREFAPMGIAVNTVSPGATLTEGVRAHMNAPELAETTRRLLSSIPLGRFAELHEVAAAVAFLASEEAGYITGQMLSVNGGAAML